MPEDTGMEHTNAVHSKSSLIIPNDLAYIPLLLNYTNELSKQAGFDIKSLHKIQIAVEEAAVNVIQNAFKPEEDANFEIQFIKLQQGLEVRICDRGLPLDSAMRPEYTPDVPLEDQTGRGLGGFLMKKFVDVYEFHNRGPAGKETRLIKYLDSHNVAEERLPVDRNKNAAAQPKGRNAAEKIDLP